MKVGKYYRHPPHVVPFGTKRDATITLAYPDQIIECRFVGFGGGFIRERFAMLEVLRIEAAPYSRETYDKFHEALDRSLDKVHENWKDLFARLPAPLTPKPDAR
jgi:hypothetical protein